MLELIRKENLQDIQFIAKHDFHRINGWLVQITEILLDKVDNW